jgi:hypothetical protein
MANKSAAAWALSVAVIYTWALNLGIFTYLFKASFLQLSTLSGSAKPAFSRSRKNWLIRASYE